MKILKIIRNIKSLELSELQLIKKYIDKQISKRTKKNTYKILEEAKSLNIFNEEEIREIEKAVEDGENEIEKLNKKIYHMKQDDSIMKIYERELRRKIEEEKKDDFVKNNIKHKLTEEEIKYQF